MDRYIAHYGVGHLDGGHSGRYPWGSGANPRIDDKARKQIAKSAKKNQEIKSLEMLILFQLER